MSLSESIKTITSEFSRIFRHLIPGVLIIGLSYISHPSWFSWVNPRDKSIYWILLGLLSIAVGNIWYVVHRFTVHNLIDWLCYRIRFSKWKNYTKWLSKHIQRNFIPIVDKEELKKFVHFRSSQIILLFILAEALIIFSFWHEKETVFAYYKWVFLIVGAVISIAGFIQLWIGFNLDVDVVENQDL